uniref:Pyrroline-5-carboxylate reductase 3 n=1 Tax=Aceria tosichella TaxID=561515 RepID=A0A6G1SR09_9ACAR
MSKTEGNDAVSGQASEAASPASSAAESTASGVPESSAAPVSDVASKAAASAVPESSVVTPASDAAASTAAPASQAAASEAGGAASSVAPSEATDASAASSAPPASPKSQASATGLHKSVTSTKSPKSPVAAGGSSTGIPPAPAPKPKESSGRKPSASGGRHRGAKLGQLKLEEAKIGIIGAGKMADALVQGLIHYAKIQANRIHVAAPSAKNLETFKSYGCRVSKRNYDIFGRYDCDIIFLCFHGNVIKNCYKLGGSRPHPITTNYIPHLRHPIYIMSMVSGVSLAQIKACLLNPESTNRYVLEIHRIMMNTAVSSGLGLCAVDCEPDSRKLSAPLRQLLSSIAHLEHVPASQMDAACAIGGSGLAFSYYFINALADGAFKMGLSRKQAIRFASKTAQCAAQTMLESGKHPAELRDTVSAPSGAAIYGIHVLEKNDVASGVTAAVEAAHKRANELANEVRQ